MIILIVLLFWAYIEFRPSIDRFVISIDTESSVRTYQYILWYETFSTNHERKYIKLFKL
jgi:hypothetical protein